MATSTITVDTSLWWDPFTDLLTDLENLSPSSQLPISLENKLRENHLWLLNSVSMFKLPNPNSRKALDSKEVKIGSRMLTIDSKCKELALEISSSLCLDEVQSYILVERSCERETSDPVALEPLHLVMLQYYIERQCVLKCTRQILMLSLYVEDGSKADCTVRDVVTKLISDGLENRLLSVIESLLSAAYPESMDADFFTLWAEEMLIEDNLVLDILFLAYYESFCTCDGKQWKKLCLLYEMMISGSCNFGKLAISVEAVQSIYHAKVQLLLILIETLYMENLLQMLHDETPFRKDNFSFAMSDIQEVDAVITRLDAFETKEAGPLILTWAVFLCLISSLPDKQEDNVLMEIDHVGYVRQAIGAASLNYFDEILHSNLLKDSEGPIAGSRSVLRTFISAFIASYEISLQLEDNNLKLILNILGEIYREEESLCVQFWDRDSFVDGPVRCLLYNLEGEFPFRTVELIRLLSALSEGAWPAECVYNFLDKSVGLTTLVDRRGNLGIDNNSRTVETRLPLYIPGLEGLEIPRNTRGHVLKVIDDNTALVRWEYTQSGVLVLLLRVTQEMYPDGSEEVLATLDLFSRLVTFNKAVCYSLMSIADTSPGKDITGLNVAEIVCNLIKNLSPNVSGALMMSMGVNILAMMLNCSPSHVTPTVLKTNIFDVASRMNRFNSDSDGLSSGSWLLSGRLAKLLLIDCEHNDSSCPLAVSVLEFTIQLLDKGIENDFLLALVIFNIQYVLVNHEYWKFKVKHSRWKVTLKVLEFLKTCISSISHSPKMGEIVRDLLLCDSSVHNALFHIVCVTPATLEKLYVSRLYELVEIEGLQLAIGSVLDIFNMLSDLSKDTLPGYSVFHQAVLSSATKPVPVVTALISLISFFRNPKIQLGAVSALSILFLNADDLQPYMSGNACFGLDDKQIADFRNSIIMIISDKSPSDEDVVNTFKMLASAANYQLHDLPAFSKLNSIQTGYRCGILNIMPFLVGSLPIRYLGVPLISSRLYKKHCDPLIDKVKSRLHNWKNKGLSFAGRLQLIKSVISSLQVFWSSVFILPVYVSQVIEKLMRGFIWSQGELEKGKAKVKWEDVCGLKIQGGLGIRSLKIWNVALMSKHIWNIVSKKDSLRVKWVNSYRLTDRILSERNFWDVPIQNDICWGWKNILQIRDVLREHIVTRIGDGCDTSVWFDNWCFLGPLCQFISKRDVYEAGQTLDCKVANVVRNGEWIWPTDLTDKFSFLIHLPPPLLFRDRKDKVFWKTNDGKICDFSVIVVWNDIIPIKPVVPWYNVVWFCQNIPRNSFILWLAVKKKLKTQDRLSSWLNMDSLMCSLCNMTQDNHNHLFFECQYSSKVWNSFKGLMNLDFVPNDLYQTIDYMLKRPLGKSIWSIIHRLVVGATVYFIWQERNLRFFQGKARNVDSICCIIKEQVRLRLMSLKVKKSFQVLKAAQMWNFSVKNSDNSRYSFVP